MARPKGMPKTGGRRKGTPNRITASMRDIWRQAFEELGGVASLVAWGRENPTDFYRAVTKMIPQDVTSGDKPLAVAGVVLLPAQTDHRDPA